MIFYILINYNILLAKFFKMIKYLYFIQKYSKLIKISKDKYGHLYSI